MKIIINPFTRQILIICKGEQVELFYTEVDEWNSFTINNKVFDIHLLYDSGLNISIYPVINNKIDYTKPVKNTIKVIY